MRDFLNPPPEFPAVPVRARRDGWTPGRQFTYVLALAEHGHGGRAAQAVGMSEQSACRLRRRPGSAAFSRLCEAASLSAKQGLARERRARIRKRDGGKGFALPGDPELEELMNLSSARIAPDDEKPSARSSGRLPLRRISR